MLLKELAKEMDGRHHSYTDDLNSDLMNSTDTFLLSQELKQALIILSQVEELINGGSIKNTLVTVKKNPKESRRLVMTIELKEKQRLRNEYEQLNMDLLSTELHSSADWLKLQGLKAKGLTLYQVMAPNAYSYVKGYVPSLAKNVKSRVHHQSMVQMEWHDGSLKNVHIDPVLLFSYQHHLQNALQVFERRVHWLQGASRRYYGCIVQKRVIFLVDLSTCMQYGLGELQLSLKQLMEEQIGHDMTFNMLCIGNQLMIFNDKMLKATKENVAACWRWFSRLSCGGTRKCMQAFTHILHEFAVKDEADGIYFITSGMPDEPEEVLGSFIKEALIGSNISMNCILFGSVTRSNFELGDDLYEDVDDTARYLRGIAHENNGRFHWIDNQVIVESDDIRLIKQEMSHVNNYLNKIKILFERLRSKATEKKEIPNENKERQLVRPSSSKKRIMLSPKHTALSSSRLQLTRPASSTAPRSSTKEQKKLPWRPSTANSSSNLIPHVRNDSSKDVQEMSLNRTDFQQRVFYTEIGNDVGTIHTSNTTPNISPSVTTIPDKEEILSSKDWLHKYSLQKIKLNFNTMVSTGKCDHVTIATLNKSVDARHCSVFPKVELKGVVKHVYSRSKELNDYKETLQKVLQRYIKRLKWLLTDSKSVFGSILEKYVVIVVDLSGSMVVHKQKLDEQFSSLVWHQLFKGKKLFNVICFSTTSTSWRNEFVEPTEENCNEVISWFHSQQCRGTTATLNALKEALSFSEVEGVYLLSDGKPDSSKSNVLRKIASLNMEKNVKIHTIAYQCSESEESAFLKLLAAQTKGRYCQYQDSQEDVEHWMKSILQSNSTVNSEVTPGLLEGDDVGMIFKEITTTKKFLQHCNTCISAVENWRKDNENSPEEQ